MSMLTNFTMAVCMMLSFASCDATEYDEQSENGTEQNETNNQSDTIMTKNMRIKVGNRTITATLEDNATARAIAERLPMTLPMMNLYGREMCYRFAEALPTDNATIRAYEVGEIIYYPPRHSFVIMYAQNGERFQMQSIGKIDDSLDFLENIGDVDVTFEAVE